MRVQMGVSEMGCEQMNSVRYFLVYLALACVAPAASGGKVAGGRAVALIEPPGANLALNDAGAPVGPIDEHATPPIEPSGNPLWAIPMQLLTATRERPLFSPSRRRQRPE